MSIDFLRQSYDNAKELRNSLCDLLLLTDVSDSVFASLFVNLKHLMSAIDDEILKIQNQEGDKNA